ncbi:MAG: putative short-chain dehydrogenase/reductase [Caulobacteraceae bacterium]|nr:putative short-chain dehydrogenase/reductase [Caulobacteraceae bacterium]
MSSASKETALVTGASSGIGAIYAERLAARGYDLILVARNQERLAVLAKHLTDQYGRKVEVIVADLTGDGLAKVEAILKQNASISLLVNNAGIGAAAPLLASDVDKMEELIAINVRAPMRLAYAAAPGFVERGGGAIINIGSIVGVAPEILNGVYGGTKAFVLALSLSLHKELADKKVRVQAVLPGATATELWERAGLPISNLPAEIVMNAEDMVDAALAGFDQGELVTIPSLPDVADWDAYEAARQKLMPNLSRNTPASRYRQTAAA